MDEKVERMKGHPTANLRNLKKQGGLAVFGKTLATTGFSGLRIETFHREYTENSPKKNEVSGFGVLAPFHNCSREWEGLRL
ncbi:hypothetical protein H8E77_20665 [bacterium]|nr:hypothetical protein [bacterium]